MRDEFLTYSPEELAQEPAFIKWVREPHEATAQVWQKWVDAHPQAEGLVAQARTVVEWMNFTAASPSETQKGKMWEAINAATSDKKAHVVQMVPRRRITPWAVAASIALVLGLGWWWMTQDAAPPHWATPLAQHETVQLPDGSSVSMNASSMLAASTSDGRTLTLRGEAFFEVTKGSPFTVSTTLGTVEVLGTSFNVRSRDNTLRVECFTGKVRVSTVGGDAFVLTPGKGVYLEEGQTPQVYQFESHNSATWRSHVHHFDNAELDEVLEELARQYKLTLHYPEELASRRYTGVFQSNSDVEAALKAVCWPMQLQYRIENNNVTITPNHE